MPRKHLASALVSVFACALLAASCTQSSEGPPIDSPRIEGQDDDGDFGGDPDVGSSVGGDDPAYSWSPPAGVQGDSDVGDSAPDPNTSTDDGSSSPSLSSSPSPIPKPPARTDTVSCYKFEYGADCLRRCKERRYLNACSASHKHPTDPHAAMGLLSGCSWTSLSFPIACSYYYSSNSDSCTFYTPLAQFSCEWSP
jgi:hypothetical protein